MLKYTTTFLLSTFLFFTLSCGNGASARSADTFMPKNDLHLEGSLYDSNITKERADSILAYIEMIYDPIFKKNGLTLTIINDWYNSEVNAVAYQRGRKAYVKMYGGLIRRWEITEDGMAMVACHEIGHHLGGFPLYSNSWASSEGNSDYFASHTCAKEIFKGAGEVNRVSCLDDYSNTMCAQQHPSQEGKDLCCRTANAAQSVTLLLGQSGQERFDTPSERVVSRTLTSHPDAQCRMDTMLQGSLCLVENYDSKIPWNEGQMRMKSCTRKKGFKEGSRPLCWFKPSNK